MRGSSRYPWMLLMALSAPLWSSYGQEKPPAPAAPLSAEEKRELLGRLHDLKVARAELEVLHGHVDADEKQDEREKILAARELELERRATAIAETERDVEKQRADFYEGAFKALTKKPSRLARAAKWALPVAAIAGAWIAVGR